MSHLKSNLALSGFGVGKKIGLGYAIALSIAVIGTTSGLAIGNVRLKEAVRREHHTREELQLLHRFQTGILQIRTHQQQLIPLARVPEDFEEEYSHILKHKRHLQGSLQEIEQFIEEERGLASDIHYDEIPAFLQTYAGIPARYLQELESRVQEIRTLDLSSPAAVAQAHQLLLAFTNSDLALELDGMSDDLVALIDRAYQEVIQAEKLLEQANRGAERIAIASILLSVATAILSAILTSRAIVRPLRNLTRIARRSTQDSNFDLQAPIEGRDEIGLLAEAFNQLIISVKELLQVQKVANDQLAAYNQTLEEKVDERTAELRERSDRLQTLLNELQHTQTKLVQAEKMSSLGQLVSGVAHEINNPVNFIHGNLTHVREYANNLLDFIQLYQEYYPDPAVEIQEEAEDIDLEFLQEDLPKMLDSMEVGTDRIRQLVLSLRNFSRTDQSEYKAVNLHEGIESTLLILQYRLKAKPDRPGIEVSKDYGNLPPVECYAGQLNQVFMNILANAIDALEERKGDRTYQEMQANPGRISIRTSAIDRDWVQIAIADNGSGIPEDVCQRIFEPFFTTKPAGKGTGLGMSISYQIIAEQHQGNLRCLQVPEGGTEFLIELPVRQRIAIPA